MTRSFYSLFLVFGLLTAGVAFGAGYYVGKDAQPPIILPSSLTNTSTPIDKQIDFAIFWKTWQILNDKFIPGVNATATNIDVAKNDQDKVYGAISGLVNSLGDPYTVFLPPQENKDFSAAIAGNFGGVGMEVGLKDGVITVISPIEGSPAKRAGILAGDKIIKINSSSTESLTIDQAVQKIRGDVGTKVKVTVSRNNKEILDFDLTREIINVPVIKTERDPSGVFIIRLFSFTSTSPKLFQEAIKQFSQTGGDKLILDLRGNPGGYLEAAVDMASWFLPKDAVVVREVHRDDPERSYPSTGYNIFGGRNLRMVILVDGGSASASEILSGALSEYGVAKLVGSKTFGKGSVQELVPITDNTSLKVTVARWFTPKGHSISQNGLDPDIRVDVLKEDIEKSYDRQQAAAIQYLTTGTTSLATSTTVAKK